MKSRKILIVAILMLSFCLSGYANAMTNNSEALTYDEKNEAIELAKKFAFEYEEALALLEMPKFGYVLLSDDTALFIEKLRYSIEFAKIFNTGIEKLKLNSFDVLMEEKRDDKIVIEVYSLSNTSALKARVAANYRQTSEWYGRNYDSSSQYAAGPFMRVVELWNYMTGNTGNGPRATGYNNNNVWTSLSVVPRTGDVLQFYSSSAGRYYHSVIVSSASNATLSNMLNKIWICQHSGDYVNRPLSETLENNGGISSGKMRLLRPLSTAFSS